jgi:hypothetical protein
MGVALAFVFCSILTLKKEERYGKTKHRIRVPDLIFQCGRGQTGQMGVASVFRSCSILGPKKETDVDSDWAWQ